MRVVIQIGYSKAVGYRKEGQKIEAFLNDEYLTFENGMYLTSRVDSSKGFCWYVRDIDMSPEDTIMIKCSTAIRGLGHDPERTFVSLYSVSKDVPVREVEVRGVGKKGYPIIKGRVLEMGSISEKDKVESEAHEFMKGGF